MKKAKNFPTICSPVDFKVRSKNYEQLKNLELADFEKNSNSDKTIDILAGADFYGQWANCGIAKHHGSLVTEQNFAKHGDRIFSSTGSFINSNLWKIQIIVQLNLNFQEICTSCSIFVRSFWFIQATDSEIFNMPYGILEMRNDQFSKESGTNFAVFHSIKVSIWLNYFEDNRNFMAHHLHKETRRSRGF